MAFVYKRYGLYLKFHEWQTHTGAHHEVSWVADINEASTYTYGFPYKYRDYIEGAERLPVIVERKVSLVNKTEGD